LRAGARVLASMALRRIDALGGGRLIWRAVTALQLVTRALRRWVNSAGN